MSGVREQQLAEAGVSLRQIAEWIGCDEDVVEVATREGLAGRLDPWQPRPADPAAAAHYEVRQLAGYALNSVWRVRQKLDRPERARFDVYLTPSGWALFGDDGLSIARWHLSRLGSNALASGAPSSKKRHLRRAEIEALVRGFA